MDKTLSGVERSFTGWLYRPYLDLSPAATGAPFHVMALEFAIRSLLEDRSYPQIQAALNASFRAQLVAEPGLEAYAIAQPQDLPASLRTERWQRLCEIIESFPNIPPHAQVRLAWLVGKLCFHRFLVELIPEEIVGRISASDASASLAYLRSNARRWLNLDDQDFPYSLDEFEQIAIKAPPSIAQVDAHYQMVVENVKYHNDLAAAEYWQPLHLRAIETVRTELDEFTYLLLMSRYHRVGSFIPQMRRDRDGVIREMDRAEQIALALPRDDRVLSIAADERLYPVLESRTKEALWLGDLALALERAQRLTALSPQDPRAWQILGEVRLKRDQVEEALQAYRRMLRLGPPGREIAWFMAGQCYEALDDLESACDAYIAALAVDPLGISSAKRLERVATRLGHGPLVQWSRLVLRNLRARQAHAHPRRAEPYKNLPPPIHLASIGQPPVGAAESVE